MKGTLQTENFPKEMRRELSHTIKSLVSRLEKEKKYEKKNEKIYANIMKIAVHDWVVLILQFWWKLSFIWLVKENIYV